MPREAAGPYLPWEERHTMYNLQLLHRKAKNYASRYRRRECNSFCRDKHREKFNKIRREGGIMEPYIKDNHGDQQNPINGNINGLFFDPYPKKVSLYGDERLMISPEVMVRMAPKLYFADFYCVGSSVHYVQLVMTSSGSEADMFCARHLIRLDLSDRINNPFLYIDCDSCKYYTISGKRLWVEVLFTENIDMNSDYCETKTVRYIGRRSGEKNGRNGWKKDASCSKCNITCADAMCV